MLTWSMSAVLKSISFWAALAAVPVAASIARPRTSCLLPRVYHLLILPQAHDPRFQFEAPSGGILQGDAPPRPRGGAVTTEKVGIDHLRLPAFQLGLIADEREYAFTRHKYDNRRTRNSHESLLANVGSVSRSKQVRQSLAAFRPCPGC